MVFCVDRRLLGTVEHLACDGPNSCTWVKSAPPDAWHLSGVVKTTPRCLDTAAALLGIKIDASPGERYTRAFGAVAPGLSSDSIPWALAMPARDHKQLVKKLINTANEVMDPVTLDYVAGTWVDGGRVLDRLIRAKVDKQAHQEALVNEANDSTRAALASFAPGPDGLSPSVMYDRLATATGRLTIMKGPQILNVRKDLRRLLVSRHGRKGVIVMLDFAALEARVVLRTAGGVDTAVPDLYGAITHELFGDRIKRDVVKTCVLSLLYGAGRRSTAERLGVDGPEVDALIHRVSERFGFARLGHALTQLRAEQGMLRNVYGRPLLLEGHTEPAGSLLVSHFAQSTGVDVTLLGFSRVLETLGAIAVRTRPTFVLHDALFLDVPLDELDIVRSVKDVTVPGFDASFPLRIEDHRQT